MFNEGTLNKKKGFWNFELGEYGLSQWLKSGIKGLHL